MTVWTPDLVFKRGEKVCSSQFNHNCLWSKGKRKDTEEKTYIRFRVGRVNYHPLVDLQWCVKPPCSFLFVNRKESSQQQIVVPISGIPYQMSTYQLTEENTDFSYRDKRHQSSMVTSIGPQWRDNVRRSRGGKVLFRRSIYYVTSLIKVNNCAVMVILLNNFFGHFSEFSIDRAALSSS